MRKIQNTFKVVSNEKLCPQFYLLRIDAKSIIREIRPGQFVHLRVKDALEPFFRRPFSVYRAQKYVEVFYEPIGPATTMMSQMKSGDTIDVLGPVGREFSAPPKGTRQVVMIAGGIGVAPFMILSDHLKKKGYELILLYGGRTKGHVYPMKEFKENGVKVFVATDDGSHGVKGRVTKLFSRINLNPQATFLYTCGPNPMMAAVQKFANEHQLKGEAACEEVMACALGACLGCSIQTKSGYRTVCYDGPVFDLSEVIFH